MKFISACFAVVIFLFPITVYGQMMEMTAAPMEMHMEHPLLNHMGMPDEAGGGNIRVSAFQERLGGEFDSSFGTHLEMGLMDRVGLHVRSDDVRKASVEIMLQYAVIRNEENEGMSVLLEHETPEKNGEMITKTNLGFSGIKLFGPNALHFTYHYDTRNLDSETEASIISTINNEFSFILEYSSEQTSSEKIATLLEGIRIKINPHVSLAFANQSPLTSDKDFDDRQLIQLSVNI